ncbi:helix-turn-helix domain-containing protein [Patescibacteria group bacterium]
MSPKFSPDQRAELISRVIRGESVSSVCQDAGISRVLFYRWLKRYKNKGIKGLSPKKAGRPNKEEKYKVVDEFTELSPNSRQMMLQEVIEQKQPVTDVAKKYNVSRTTVYKWINRYKRASIDNKDQSLVSKTPKVSRYYRQTPEKYVEAVLSLVAAHPEFGIRKIVTNLPTIGDKPIVGHHGVQNILKRNGLSTYEERLKFAQSKITPVTKTIEGVLGWVSKFFGFPPEFRARAIRFLGVFALTTFSSIVVFGLGGLIVRSFGQATGASPTGLFFASLALFMGSIFFLYSFKYYLTIVFVLSFSQREGTMVKDQNGSKSIKTNILDWILGSGKSKKGNTETSSAVGMEPNLSKIKLNRKPFVSVHIPFYNEKNVVERSIEAVSNFDYPEYEIILCDDSTDETTTIIRNYQKKCLLKGEKLGEKKGKGWILTWVEIKPGVTLKHIHRTTREGFKGGALQIAKELSDPRTEFISIFDADFVPYSDSLELFLKYFKAQNNMSEEYKSSKVAVVQGYQWHVLNKSENWITRGVRCEYSGSYVIERPGSEIYGGLKQISGSVYMIRKDVLDEIGWGTSITEDFELTLKLYEKGYKVVYSPYIQAPAECVSTTKRLIRQRMRWAEGHSQNIKRMFKKLIFNPKLKFTEKLEFLYLTPYYLQAFFFLIGTISWFISETIFPARLPFWTSLWGWSLVLTNMFSLPLMNAVGLFLEESEERDYLGLASFMGLSYLLVPFQAYAALKGFFETDEGPWFRTPKTGRITDVFTRGKFYRFITGIIPGFKGSSYNLQKSYIEDKYFSLATANNQFDNFSVSPRKRMRWTSKVLLSFLLVITVTIYSLTYKVSTVRAELQADGINIFDSVAESEISAGTTWLLKDTGDSITESLSCSIKTSKGTSGTAQYIPGTVNNSSYVTPDQNNPTDNGWIIDTSASGEAIATGTWTATVCIVATDSDGDSAAELRVLAWRATISGGAVSATSGDLIFDTTSSGCDLYVDGNCSATSGSVTGFTFVDAKPRIFTEVYAVISAAGDANDVTRLTVGGTDCATTSRIISPAVTVPEWSLALILIVPFIPLFIKNQKDKKLALQEN